MFVFEKGKEYMKINNFSQICDRYQQGSLETLAPFFKNKHVKMLCYSIPDLKFYYTLFFVLKLALESQWPILPSNFHLLSQQKK